MICEYIYPLGRKGFICPVMNPMACDVFVLCQPQHVAEERLWNGCCAELGDRTGCVHGVIGQAVL